MYQPDQTFFLKAPGDLLEMLKWQLENLRQTTGKTPRAAAYRMLECAQTAWALCDWVWSGMSATQRLALQPTAPISGLSEFRLWVRQQSVVLNYCRHLADAFKHQAATKSDADPLIESIDFGIKFDEDEYRYWALTDAKNQVMRLDDVIEQAVQFWADFLKARGLDGPSPRASKVVELS